MRSAAADFEADEARADDQRTLRAGRLGDDGAAIGERAQRMDVRQIGARNRQPHRLGAGRQQQPVVIEARAIGAADLALLVSIAVTSVSSRKSILLVAIKIVRPQRHPFLRRAAGEIVLGQIGPVDRRRGRRC